MPSEMNNILKFNQYIKSDKMTYIIYADIESLIKKMHECANNPEKSSTTKIGENIPSGYSMSTIWAFDHIQCTKNHISQVLEYHGKLKNTK